MSARTTRRRLALALALLGAVALALLSGYHAWRRATRPLLRVSLAKSMRVAHLVANGRVLAVGDRLDGPVDLDPKLPPRWLWHLTALDSGQDLGTRETPASDTLVGWAPTSGKALLRTDEGALVALDLLSGVRRTLLQHCESETVALSPAEDLAAFVTSGGEVTLDLVAPGTSASWSVLPGAQWSASSPVFSPAGDLVAVTGNEDELTVWSTRDRLPVTHGRGAALGFTRDGGVLSRQLSTPDHVIVYPTLHVYGPGREERSLASDHPDESWVASSNVACVAGVEESLEGPGVAVVVRSTATGAVLRRLARAGPTRSLELSPEGDLLVVLDETAAEVWEIPPP